MFAPAVRRLRSAADVARRFNEADSAFGRLDVLVNNAGIFRFGDFAEKSFHLHYNINVLGLILTMQDAIKRFGSEGRQYQFQLDRRLASGAGSLLYASTKGAVENLTKGLALELTPRKIRVNAIAPGHTETEGNGAGAVLRRSTSEQDSAWPARSGHRYRAAGRVPGIGLIRLDHRRGDSRGPAASLLQPKRKRGDRSSSRLRSRASCQAQQ